MNNTEITPELLLKKGFQAKIIEGKTYFIKGKACLHYDHVWIPDNTFFGRPLDTNAYVKDWEELERLANDAGIDIN